MLHVGVTRKHSIPGRDKRLSFPPEHLDWLWVLSSIIFNEYSVLFAWGKLAGGMKLSTHLHLLPRLRMKRL